MKKFFAIFFIFCLGLTLAYAAPKKSKGAVIRSEIETKDNFIIVGDFYPSKVKGAKMPLVIMLHSFGGKSGDWGVLQKKISDGGYNVFALDLRGHGRSVYNADLSYRSYKYFTKKAWARLPQDVLDTINYLKENYARVDYNNIIFVGADLGANAAVLAGNEMKTKPKKMVLVSPAQEFKGLYIPVILANFPKTEFMFVVSKTDRYFFQEANLLTRFVQSNFVFKTYEQGSSGTILLKRNPTSYDEIYNFIYDTKTIVIPEQTQTSAPKATSKTKKN